MLGVPVKTQGCIEITINAGVNRKAQPVWCTTSCLVVGLDAGHDSYMCRIVYVDASGFLVLSVVSCSSSRALTCQEDEKHPQGTFWKGAAAMGGGL